MKKALSIIITVLLVLSLFSGCTKEAQYAEIEKSEIDSIAAVSFNCAAPWGNMLQGTGSSARVKRFAEYMNTIHPDIIGTQEMNQKWLDKLSELMSDYEAYGVKRGGDDNENKSEMNAVFWLKDKYAALDKGTFWLSETPETESRYDGAGCHRICTWVILESSATGDIILHMNTHLDNASEEAANYGAEVILQKLQEITSVYPNISVVLTGDFNETEGMAAYNTAAGELNEARIVADTTETKGTYQDWGKLNSDEPIDFIFISQSTKAIKYQVLDDISGGYVSDHFGIYAELLLNANG